ncbi:MAG TPA: LURP-one-related family protein [Methanomassiliicoccales archaeon]|nr:LURP-one-related family protein [Methanomassiliicoccales archaeon]
MSAPGSILTSSEYVLKKKILSLSEHYDLEDRTGARLGEADGKIIQLPAKFVVKDALGQEVMRLEGKVLALRSQFTFYDNLDVQIGIIRKKIVKFIGDEYWVEKDGAEIMRIYGNFVEHDYRMEIGGQLVAQVHKRWFTIRDWLEVSVLGNVDHRIVLGAVIAIEHQEVTERRNSG